MERQFRFIPKEEIKNIPVSEYLDRIKEKYFIDKSMDFLLGFWFALRVIESKLTQLLPIDNEGNLCLSEREELYYSELISAFILFGKSALELVIKFKVENRKVHGFIQWFMYYFLGIYSPQREIVTFNTLMYSGIPILVKETGEEFIYRELVQDEIKKIRRVLNKEPTDFLKGMQYCFEFVDKFFLILPPDVRDYILNREHLKSNVALLKTIIDKIVLKRSKRKFNIIDQTVVASIGMVEFLRNPIRLSRYGGLKRDYESKISDE